MRVAAILAAGGLGTRLGSDTPKQFLDLGDGRTMLDRCVGVLLKCDLIDEIVVAHPPGEWIGGYAINKLKPIRSVPGGTRRQDSVANALAAVSDAADVIVIHDAARPFASEALFERTIRAAQEHGAAIAAVPAIDTIKQVQVDAGGVRTIRATLPRETIFLAQTPQAFQREVLRRALAGAHDVIATDEAMLVERAGLPVHIVEGETTNIKVTGPADLEKARMMARGQERVDVMRIGVGYDLHRLVTGRPLILAGVHVPFDRGLLGHSDADIVCHAVTDAILGGAAMGDIGRSFPDTDATWKDADSIALVRDAMGKVRAARYMVVNVDVTVIAERPKLLPHVEQMRANLAAALAVDVAAVSIKGKTNEGVGEIGRGEAMACHAVALLRATTETRRP
jgi:2-C-methyl-D-erythritol 4-phosphate cytidylyltransferase/2-C-methyl-D-erythritol 2,4-cyclodiphosphate synthase